MRPGVHLCQYLVSDNIHYSLFWGKAWELCRREMRNNVIPCVVSFGSIILRDWPNPWGTGINIPSGFFAVINYDGAGRKSGRESGRVCCFCGFSPLSVSWDMWSCILFVWVKQNVLLTNNWIIGAWGDIAKGLTCPSLIILYVWLYITQVLWWSPEELAEQVFKHFVVSFSSVD